MYLSTSTSTEDFPEMYLSTFQVLYKLYLGTDVLKYKVLLPGSGTSRPTKRIYASVVVVVISDVRKCLRRYLLAYNGYVDTFPCSVRLYMHV